jgi:RNA polymerase sigma-70 factor (ECF subfamily)
MHAARREELLQRVVHEHGLAIARLAGSYERGSAQRDELVQEILLNVWRALPSFREEASLRTWVYRIAHNVAIRHVQRDVRRPRAEEDEPDEQPTTSSVDDEVDIARSRRRLRKLVAALKPTDQEIIILYLEDVAQDEIAAITGLTQANISTRVHRIKQALAEGMKR